ncbi:ferric reductase like transmembrane component [Diplodia corticola]|uniref:Ferric reductase like transmembrane component n=1 Tax=Diplodia corticola TaxID=236234 RepID=A0A1J9QKX2_9PEZI|nr:ferric reductase like transmembrane component [Diplodia corticola]OJD29120.1 ferric reductase like transmembrane component [Diplodia corticola]
MLGYEFVTLDDEQKAARRELLNLYGTIGQWSVLAVLVVAQLAFVARWAVFRASRQDRPRSPHPTKTMALEDRAWSRRLEEKLTRFRWWANEPLRDGWFTNGECILGLVWTLWLLFLSVHRTGNDYLHLTKRFGMVAASQLPLQYILAMRSAYSPIQALTRLPYERVVAIHELLGKILTAFFALHAAFYFNFFVQNGLVLKRIQDVDVITGLIGFAMFSTMSTTALSYVRNWNYRVFYTTHILLAIVLVDVLIFHVSHIRTYVFEMLAAFVLLQIFRQAKTRQFSGSIALIPGTNLIQVTVPLPFDKDAKEFKPGQHVHLSKPPLGQPSLSYANTFAMRYRTNPFTVASVPTKDRQLLLVARSLAGNTQHLAAVARSLRNQTTDGNPSIPLTIEGPYGASLPDFREFDHVLFVAGGVGATFTVPVFRSMTEGTHPGDQPPVPRTRLRFVWAVRRLAETRWAFPAKPDDARGLPPTPAGAMANQSIDIFVTRGPDAADEEDGREGLLADDDEDIELADAQTLVDDRNGEEKSRDRTVSRGRPDLAAIVDEAFEASSGAVAVLVCGPGEMAKEMRRHVGAWVKKGKDVFWYAEAFGM